MTVERTTRLNVYTWSDDGDEFTRDQMTTSHEVLEERVAQFFLFPGLPTGVNNPPARLRRSFHLDQTTNVLYFYDTSDQWRALNAHAAPTSTLAPSGTNTAGSATTYARSDHSHAMLPWATTTQPVGTVSSAGTDNAYARQNHVHVVGNGAIANAAMLVDGVVSTAKIAANAVTTAKIAANAVTKDRLATDQQLPTGMISPFGGAVAPTGWLLCDGAGYNPSDGQYAALYAVIGFSYGQTGSNFRVPDLRNRVPQGADTTARGSSAGGSVTLSTANLPSHQHEVGTYVNDTHAGHQHAASGLSTATGGSHSHTTTLIDHNHGIFPGLNVYVKNVSPFFINLTGPINAFSVPISEAPWGTGTRPHDASNHPWPSTTHAGHSHTVNGSTASNGNHTHTLSGSSASVGGGEAFTVAPAHVGVNYIIKL